MHIIGLLYKIKYSIAIPPLSVTKIELVSKASILSILLLNISLDSIEFFRIEFISFLDLIKF